jgi:gluconolactonase
MMFSISILLIGLEKRHYLSPPKRTPTMTQQPHSTHSDRSSVNEVPSPKLARRSFLAAAATATAAVGVAALAREYGPGAQPVRYPDPDIITLDKRFKKYALGNTPIQRIYHSKEMLWAEGPAWSGVGRYLLWSDIPNDVQMRWLEEDGHVSKFRSPAGNSNGNTFDFEGRQIAFEHGTRSVARYEHSGKRTVLASSFGGKSLNGPNDGAVHPDGAIWFTDPGYGGLMNYEGNKAAGESKQPYQKEAIYRIDRSGKMEKVSDEPFKPNGLCFSPDYKKLYVAETGASHYETAPKNIWVFDVIDAKKLGPAKEFASMKMTISHSAISKIPPENVKFIKVDDDPKRKLRLEVAGFADGIRADVDGNIWASAGWVGDGYDGVHVFAPDGTRIGQILLPEICSNVCFGGRKRNRLFMTASTSVYAVYVETQGAHIT